MKLGFGMIKEELSRRDFSNNPEQDLSFIYGQLDATVFKKTNIKNKFTSYFLCFLRNVVQHWILILRQLSLVFLAIEMNKFLFLHHIVNFLY